MMGLPVCLPPPAGCMRVCVCVCIVRLRRTFNLDIHPLGTQGRDLFTGHLDGASKTSLVVPKAKTFLGAFFLQLRLLRTFFLFFFLPGCRLRCSRKPTDGASTKALAFALFLLLSSCMFVLFCCKNRKLIISHIDNINVHAQSYAHSHTHSDTL